MTDKELLDTIQTMIRRHLCPHQRQFQHLIQDLRIEERVCQDCGILLQSTDLKEKP